jgi:hypothetical protein
MIRTRGWGLLALAAILQGCMMPPPPPPPPPHGGRPLPPEFMQACEGQAEGAGLQVPGRHGEALQGTCQRTPDGRLAFMPGRPPR